MVAVGRTKVAVGERNDARYIMLNPTEGKSRIAYSFGKGDNLEWDIDLVCNYGCELFLHDPTMSLPRLHPRFHFHNKNVLEAGGIAELIALYGHQDVSNFLMKVDIEGDEWELFDAMDSSVLEKFEQFACEFHWLDFSPEANARSKSVLNKINKTHQVIHIHGNNNSSYVESDGYKIPYVLEVT